MLEINDLKFGSIVVDGKKYTQILVVNNQVEQRKEKELRKEFGTTHYISEYEQDKLISNSPKVILIGTGMTGQLKVFKEFEDLIKNKNAKLIIQTSKKAIKTFEKLTKQKIKFNALIHTTC